MFLSLSDRYITILNHLLLFARCKLPLINVFTRRKRVKTFRLAIDHFLNWIVVASKTLGFYLELREYTIEKIKVKGSEI
jgi:hypothetical protein